MTALTAVFCADLKTFEKSLRASSKQLKAFDRAVKKSNRELKREIKRFSKRDG